MTKKKKRPFKTSGNDWTIVQVAAHILKPYQSTRNMMLRGAFGLTKYDPDTRRLTVKESAVRQWKTDTENTTQ